VEDDHPYINGLLEFLRATSPKADSTLAETIKDQAGKCLVDRWPEMTVGDRGTAAWLPNYSVPRALWYVYQGQRDRRVTELAQPDLEAIDPPSGMNEEEFNAYVGSVLLQGFPGVLVERLNNLSTYKAVSELRRLSELLGIEISDPEKAWGTLAAWCAYFLPDRYTIGPGGKKLQG